MRALEIRPFPLDRLARVTRADVALLREVVRAGPPSLEAMPTTLGARLGAPVRISAEPFVAAMPGDWLARRLAPRVVAVVFDHSDGTRAVLDVDPTVVAVVADRVLGGDGGAVAYAGAEHVGPVERGLLAASLLEACAAAGATAAGWRLSTILETSAGVVESLASARRVVLVPLRVEVGAFAGSARLCWGDAGLAAATRPHSQPADAFARIAALPLTIVAVAGRARVTPRELRSLRPSDVLVLDTCSVRRVEGTREVDGHVALWLRGAARSFARARVQSRTLVHTTEEATVDTSPDDTDPERARELLGDQPVEIVVEIARAVLRADEVMAIRPGEVVRTGAPVTAEVRLVAAGRVLARGELVDVEGEVGVRILATY